MLGINNKFAASLQCMIVVITLAGMPVAFAADVKQKTFSTAQEAVDALIAANRSSSKSELLKILGPDADKLINSGDPVADTEGREKFIAAYDAAHKLEDQGSDKKTLVVGNNEWPLPIPLVRQNDKWRFDTEAGEQEILDRRIGRNELNVIEVCRAYVEAQREYADEHSLGDGKHEYAQRFLSHDGKHDGLYWPTNAGEQESPLGPLIAFAQAGGTSNEADQPYHGYYYKILTAQSENARGGAIDYISGDHMTEGFALLAYPAKYGDSGIMSFIVNQNGIVHEKDMGSDTANISAQIKQYNPDDSWEIP